MSTNRMNSLSGGALALAAILLSAAPLAGKEPSPALNLARQLNQAFIEVADQVSPSVVVIRVAHKPSFTDLSDEENPLWEMLPPEFRKQMEEHREKQRKQSEERPSSRAPVFDGQGSGVVIREEGYILTNRHVVDGAEKIKVRFQDGSEYDAEVRGVDAQSDVAVIKIDPKARKLVVAKLADSEKTRVGEFAIAIGAPFSLDYSVTFGHVSAKGRSVIMDRSLDQDFIQTDANINPGNSGGPLVNIDGEVIGINTLIRGMRTGIGFAIPSNLAREVADRLVSDGKYVRAYLGVGIVGLKEHEEYRDLMTSVTNGVVISAIPPDGPAARSELKPGDVIMSVDGRSVGTAQQLKNEVRGKKIGQPVTLEVHRNGKNLQVKVKPEAWPDETTPVLSKSAPAEEEGVQSFGLTVKTLTRTLAEQFGVEKMEGVIVTAVEKGSVAERKGLRAGDIITDVNQKGVATPKEFLDALKNVDPKRGVIINFTSRGTSKFEVLKESGD